MLTTRVLTLFSLLLCSGIMSAQSLWLRRAGGSNLDEALDIARVSSNNDYYVTGHFAGVANFESQNLSSEGSSDAFLSKYNTNGQPIWAKRFGGSATDRSNAVVCDASGNAYICGYFTDEATFGSFTLTSSDSTDAFIAKVSAGGDVVWVKQAGSNGNDAATGIAIDANGNVYVTGQFRGTVLFGSTTLTSANYSGGGPSVDLFISKLDNNGNWIWTKKGSSVSDERPSDICVDSNGNPFVTGQFSYDITFDQLHPNNVVNAGFLVKLNTSGAEQWFSRIAGTMVSPQAVRCDSNNNVYLTGDNIGQVIFFATTDVIMPSTWQQSIFLAKYGSTGNIIWTKEDGSESYVSSKAISIGTDNEIYIAGTFECIFTEYSDELGEGLFNSAGYKDVFVARFDATGTRQWERQYGGPRNDFCSAVVAGGAENAPRIAGSFEKYFHAPASSLFVPNPTNFLPDPNDLLTDPNSSACGNETYGYYIHLKAQANKDIFIGNLYNSSLPHYDYYARGACDYSIVEPCITESNIQLDCQDEIISCGPTLLFATWNTGTSGWIGPEYAWDWTPNANGISISVGETGWYSLETERADGCASFTDSIYVEILEVPIPTITDDEGVNFESPPQAEEINLCYPDEVLLTGGDLGSGQTWWQGPGGTVQGDEILATEDGSYTLTTIGSNGCEGTNSVQVVMIDPLEEIDPLLQFSTGDQPTNDTLIICGHDYINVELIDQLAQETFPLYTDAVWQIEYPNGTAQPYDGFETYSFEPTITGWYTINSTPFLFVPEPCVVDTTWYPTQSLELYVVVLADPDPAPVIEGMQPLCPGDTLLLVASGALNYSWSGPGIIEELSEDSVLVNVAGGYSVSSFEEYDNGCSSTTVFNAIVPLIPAPVITADPANGIICPGASIELTAPNAASYQWIGPSGQDLGTNQSISITQPGNYFCEVTQNECTQESNVFEAQAYSTPYLVALPNADLCESGYALIVVQSLPDAVITWLPPFSGNATYQAVFDAGEYFVQVEYCDVVTEASIVITDTQPVAVITSSQEYICPGSSVILSTTPGMESYSWMPGNINASSITVTQPGTYSVSFESQAGCESESTDFIIESYDIDSPVAANDQVCIGEPAYLACNGNSVFWATDIAGTNVIGTTNNLVTDPVFENFTLYVFAQDENCASLGNDVFVSIYPSSIMPILASDSAGCAGFDLTVSTTTGLNFEYNWTTPDGSTYSTASFTIDNVTGANSGWYILEGNDSHCSTGPDSLFILVEEPFSTGLIGSDRLGVCEDGTLTVETTFQSDSYNWVTPLGNFTDPAIIIQNAAFNAEGTYSVTMPGAYCETIMDTVYVFVSPYPDFEISAEDVYCEDGYMTAHVPWGYDIYEWNTGDTDNDAIVPTDGFVSVTVTNLPDCSNDAYFIVQDIDCIDEFPNIFTPDGDGSNDFVDFGWLRIPIDEVLIYNRWGNLLRQLYDAPFVWDGKTEASEFVSDGVYYYVIKSGAPGKHFNNLSGYIHVIGLDNKLRN